MANWPGFVFLGFLSSTGTSGVCKKARTKGWGATVHLLRMGLMGVSPHSLPQKTKSYSFISKSVGFAFLEYDISEQELRE